ncbi:MAG: ATP-dependent Zn protease, partial [Chloroflexota bacterium]
MKRFLYLVLLILLTVGLVACGGTAEPTEAPAAEEPAEEPVEEPEEEEPAEEPTEEEPMEE